MVRLDAATAGSRAALKAEAVQSDIAMLETMTHDALKEHWRNVFGVSAPHNLSRRLLIHALAYEAQVKAYGGLRKDVHQALQDMVDAASTTSGLSDSQQTNPDHRTPPRSIALSPGTRLMREWRGVVHVVDRVEDGFIWSGQCFKSLSAIARAITGVRWNGLAFFGLRKRKESSRNIPDVIKGDELTAMTPQPHDQERNGNLNNHPPDATRLSASSLLTLSRPPSLKVDSAP